jgi:hypothetical protein
LIFLLLLQIFLCAIFTNNNNKSRNKQQERLLLCYDLLLLTPSYLFILRGTFHGLLHVMRSFILSCIFSHHLRYLVYKVWSYTSRLFGAHWLQYMHHFSIPISNFI